MIRFVLCAAALIACTHSVARDRPSLWLYNITKDEIVKAYNHNHSMPIASITKLMTAMIALDNDTDLDRKIIVSAGSKLGAGWHTRRDVLTAMLVRSDNYAAESLAQDFPGGRRAFVSAMNQRAESIGMQNTRFGDPSGLSSSNVSTASSIGTMVMVASMYPFIVETSVKKHVLFEVNRKRKIRTIALDNTNRPLLFEFDQIKVSKTGFTNPAGWCVGMLVKSKNQEFIVVILNARSKQDRYQLAKTTIYNQLQDIDVDKIETVAPENQIYEPLWWHSVLDTINRWIKID
jgi:D-alanyl-D-alanine endopeptidase (penicillin-binding protein 7)